MLVIALGLGIFISRYQQLKKENLSKDYQALEIEVVNLDSNSATITWQTKLPAVGQVIFWLNSNEILKSDDREKYNSLENYTHFVTLDNLNPNTEYFFRIKNNNFYYPNSFFSFKTSEQTDEVLSNQVIISSVVDQSYQPIDEAIIFLKLEGSKTLATFTTDNGNFLLATTNLKDEDLNPLKITSELPAILIVTGGQLNSEVKIKLNPSALSLPPIILGQNLDFSSINQANIKNNPLDLNSDGEVNSLDVAIVLNNFNKDPQESGADISGDGKIGQDDIDLIKKYLRE